MNQHELKNCKQDGKTIGTLDFGTAIIELITDESISIVYESQESTLPLKPKTK